MPSKSNLPPVGPRRVDQIVWEDWTPVDRGTILFVVRDRRILLIRKKRGLGAGKINGPGGRLVDGESPLNCAIRETREEIGVLATAVRECGQLLFQFTDGYSIHVWVFRADDCVGEPVETDEADPFWVPVVGIPYAEMWPDDEIWLPLLLQERPFAGRFVFEGDVMLDYQLDLHHTPDRMDCSNSRP